MITRICVLLEAISIVVCLHHLFGEKVRLDLKTVAFLAVDMILMTTIDYCHLPSSLSLIIYIIIAFYCKSKFREKWKKIIVIEAVCIMLVGSMQLVASFLYYYISNVQDFIEMDFLIINILVLLMISILVPRMKMKSLLKYLQQKEKILIASLIMCTGVILIYIITFKQNKGLAAYEYIILFAIILFICILAAQMEKYKMKSAEIETELKMQKVYSASFDNLIQDIRMRQHEFDNHINTIFSQHYIYHTFEELVNAQRSYGQEIIKVNHYNKLLTNGNPALIGFLYGKFIELDKQGVKVEYEVNIKELSGAIPVYRIVEILGDLINNAVEAMEETKKEIFIKIVEVNDWFEIEVGNISCYVDYEEISKFFDKGYSKKGENRGLGLYNVKKICEEYKLSIVCINENIENENWLMFKITNRKKNERE